MNRFNALRAGDEFSALLNVSKRLGRDPLQIQGPGGNTSIKNNGAMWVKASGTWLADACERDIMVPVDASAMKSALMNSDGVADANDVASFVPRDVDNAGLRPSIETALHAALDWPVVLHTHCVATIAASIRIDAEVFAKKTLEGINVAFVSYFKPGIDLARAVLKAIEPSTRVIILGNHGLLICEETVAKAEALLRLVSSRLEPEPIEAISPAIDPAFEASLDGTDFMPVHHAQTQTLARDPTLLNLANGTSLYPDHVIFLGPGIALAQEGEAIGEVAARIASEGPQRHLIIVPGKGVAIKADASPSMIALAKALGDVLTRADPTTSLSRLSGLDEFSLLNWDAEKYRQELEAKRRQPP